MPDRMLGEQSMCERRWALLCRGRREEGGREERGGRREREGREERKGSSKREGKRRGRGRDGTIEREWEEERSTLNSKCLTE